MDTTETVTSPAATPGPDPNHPNRLTLERLKVLHDYLVIELLAPPEKRGLMFMPDASSERDKSHRGIVLATGPGAFNEAGTDLLPMSVEVGDLVFFGKYAGTLEELGGRELLVMREQELRFKYPESAYEVVRHEGAPKASHLVDDYCEICHGKRLFDELPPAAAPVDLAKLREAAGVEVPASAPELQAMGGAATLAMSQLRDDQAAAQGVEDVIEDMNRHLAGELLPDEEPPRVLTLEGSRRVCPHCSMMQRLAQTTQGLYWVGAVCGHVDVGGRLPPS